MLDLSAVLAFSAAALLLTITPGLDTALVLRTAAVEGSSRARLAALGICTGTLAWGLATALGLTALLALSRLAYDAVRVAGACYLIFLGVQMWRRKYRQAQDAVNNDGNGAGHRWFVRGLLSNLLNPKVGVFYITLLPQFVPAGGNVGTYILAFTLINVTQVIVWLTLVAAAVRPVRAWIERPSVKLGLDRTTGTVLIGSGLALAIERRR